MEKRQIYSTVRWTEQDASTEAKKYNSRSEFKRESSGAYCFLLRNGLLENACKHMTGGINIWTKGSVINEAKKYSKRCDFKNANHTAYLHARKNGYIEEACKHMKEVVWWDYDKVKTEALKYQTKEDFRQNCLGAYCHAHRRGFIENVCSHMVDGDYGFSKTKPAIMYYIHFLVDGAINLYKIGITNRSAESRLKGMLISKGVEATILKTIEFKNGDDARKMEKKLQQEYKEHRYSGEPIMKNGNSELFTQDILSFG